MKMNIERTNKLGVIISSKLFCTINPFVNSNPYTGLVNAKALSTCIGVVPCDDMRARVNLYGIILAPKNSITKETLNVH